MENTIIQTQNLEKVFHESGIPVTVIHNLNLEIRSGEFVAIMGSSGSGKSTLMYLLSGLDAPTKGEVRLVGQYLATRNEKELALIRRRHVGFVFQDYSLVPNLTLLENVLVAGYLGNANRKQVLQDAKALFRLVDLDHLTDRFPSQVSGGEQQRCAIVRALINAPKILMADEPTGNLNSAASSKVLDCLSSFHEAGQTIIMVTHDVHSAARATRVIYLNDGAITDEFIFTNGKNKPIEMKATQLLNWLKQKEW